jgi:hypothetical protein
MKPFSSSPIYERKKNKNKLSGFHSMITRETSMQIAFPSSEKVARKLKEPQEPRTQTYFHSPKNNKKKENPYLKKRDATAHPARAHKHRGAEHAKNGARSTIHAQTHKKVEPHAPTAH